MYYAWLKNFTVRYSSLKNSFEGVKGPFVYVRDVYKDDIYKHTEISNRTGILHVSNDKYTSMNEEGEDYIISVLMKSREVYGNE